MSKRPIVIAIDGVSGAGKSTLARTLARRLGFSYLDTGAMYRALTYKALLAGGDFSDPKKLHACVKNCKLRLSLTGKRVWLDGREVTRQIRGVAVSGKVSVLAGVPQIRSILVGMQREMAKQRPVVMEGRDIGTVVFPKAPIKFFVTASLEERAKRRLKELRTMGIKAAYRTILKNLAKRDHLDSHRKVSPLRRAPDAILIDSTRMTLRQKADYAMALVQKKSGRKIRRAGL